MPRASTNLPDSPTILSNRSIRYVLVGVAILACLWTIKTAATFGMSRLFTRYALGVQDLRAANEAVQLTPSDAEAHYASSVVTAWFNPPQDAILEMERADVLNSCRKICGSQRKLCKFRHHSIRTRSLEELPNHSLEKKCM